MINWIQSFSCSIWKLRWLQLFVFWTATFCCQLNDVHQNIYRKFAINNILWNEITIYNCSRYFSSTITGHVDDIPTCHISNDTIEYGVVPLTQARCSVRGMPKHVVMAQDYLAQTMLALCKSASMIKMCILVQFCFLRFLCGIFEFIHLVFVLGYIESFGASV